jgi:beta-lactamase regulating signal transducer with metallopeptidase domain
VKVSPRAPAFVLFALLAGGCLALLVRCFGWRRFARRMRALRAAALRIDTRFVGCRRVPVLISREYDGPPFTAGLLRPYVLLPARGVRGLREEQRRAVIEHELAHVRHLDVLLVGALLYVSAFFWFLPGVSWLVARIRALVEQSADDAAVRAGVDPVALASALVEVAEALTFAPEAELAVGRSRRALLARATRLVSPERAGSRALGALRVLALALVGAGVLSSFFLGNHTITLH